MSRILLTPLSLGGMRPTALDYQFLNTARLCEIFKVNAQGGFVLVIVFYGTIITINSKYLEYAFMLKLV